MTGQEQKLKKYIEMANRNRREWAQNDALRDAGVTEPEGVRQLTNISYADSESEDEKQWHLMDIYYPAQEGPHPVIVSIHGGGWFYGDKELYKPYTMHLASYGFAVVNFNYRLSPEYPYPAGFEDVCSLIHYLALHAKEYDLDLDQIYMVGDSAGAQLVSQYSIYATNGAYRELFSFGERYDILVPKRVALNCGVYDIGELYQKDTATDWYLPFSMEKDTALSVFRILDFMTESFPETYLMLSVNDELAKHTKPMKRKLESLGISFVYREIGLDNAQDGHVFHLNLRSKNGKNTNDEEIEFFRGHNV